MFLLTPPPITIKRYLSQEIDPIHQIITACGKNMENQFGSIRWLPPEPIDLLCQEAVEREVYGIHTQKKGEEFVVGTFTIDLRAWDGDVISWKDPHHKALYLYRLAIHPDYQRQKFGHLGLKAIIEIARERHCDAIRCDVFPENTKIIRFYRNQGFQVRGTRATIDWRGLEWENACLEKLLA